MLLPTDVDFSIAEPPSKHESIGRSSIFKTYKRIVKLLAYETSTDKSNQYKGVFFDCIKQLN